MLSLLINKQIIKITNDERFIRGTVGAKCNIELDECWNGYTKTIVFKHSSSQIENKKIIINSLNEEITIPWEVLQVSGAFKIGFYATSDTEVLPTLWSGLIEIKSGTTTDGTAPTEYTPSEIEQLKLQKQDKLIPGANIIIEDNVISVLGGGGSGGIVDQIYNPESSNAQSGKAVAEAIAGIEIPEGCDIIVDQTYNPESPSAQSGVAVSQAIATKTLVQIITWEEDD